MLADLSTIWKSCNFSLRFTFLGHGHMKSTGSTGSTGSTHRGSLGTSARARRLVPICCCHGNFRRLAAACDETKRWTVTTSGKLISSSAVQHGGRFFFCCGGASATWKHRLSPPQVNMKDERMKHGWSVQAISCQMGTIITHISCSSLTAADVKINAHFIVINGLIKCVISCEFL